MKYVLSISYDELELMNKRQKLLNSLVQFKKKIGPHAKTLTLKISELDSANPRNRAKS